MGVTIRSSIVSFAFIIQREFFPSFRSNCRIASIDPRYYLPWADPNEKRTLARIQEKGIKKGTKCESEVAGVLLLAVVILPRTFAPRYEQGKPVEGFKAARRVQRSMLREVFHLRVRARKSISYLRGSVMVAYEVTCYYRRFAASLWAVGIHVRHWYKNSSHPWIVINDS